jgi:hypothetical protein
MHPVRDILLPVASAVMIACIVLSLVAISHTVGSTWNVNYLVPLSALVAIESYFSIRLDASVRWRIVELALLYAVLEAVDTLSNGGTLRAALTPHFDQGVVAGAILLLFVWLGIREMAAMLPEIHKSMEPTSVVAALALRFVAGGIFLFVIAGATQRSVAGALRVSNHASSGPLLNVLLYFVLGMLIISYLQYESMQQRWEIQQVRVVGDIQSSWLRMTAALMVLALVVAVILPTTQVFGLTAIVGAIWHLISGLGLGIWNHAPGTGSAPPLGKVFGHGHHPIPTPAPPPHGAHGITAPSWLATARTALFWVVLIVALAIMLFRVNWGAVTAARPGGRRLSLAARLARLWRRLWQRARSSARTVAALVPRSLPRRTGHAPAGPLRRFLRINALSPEEQVRYFYLSLLRRASAQGIVRPPSQTPGEFAGRLSAHVGDAGPDLNALTSAFIEARYSGHHVERERLNPIRAHWQRVRDALRRRSRAG